MKRFLVAGILMTAAVSSVHAQSNLRFLQDTPISKFKKADTDLMFKTLYQALDTAEDGKAVTWENPKASNSGSITPEKDPQGTRTCRLSSGQSRESSPDPAQHPRRCVLQSGWQVEMG
jgi:surface antigen